MDAKYESRKRELLDECSVDARILERVVPRLEKCMDPFVELLVRKAQVEHANTLVQGLRSDRDHKKVESMAYRFGQERMPRQGFVGVSDWDDEPLRDALVRPVGKELGEEDAVMAFDPSGFPKSGRASVGTARQWCGRLGTVGHCPVALDMGYASSREHALVAMRLDLPKAWTQDQERCQKAGVPKDIRYRTRHPLCLEMLKKHGTKRPHPWITGDDEMGRPDGFRRRLDRLDEQYLLAVPCNTLVRDLEVDPPPYSGRGRKPKRPGIRVDQWVASCRDGDWTEMDVRDGARGPLIVDVVQRCVVARTDKRQEGPEDVLVVIRSKDGDNQNVVKTDSSVSNASPDTPNRSSPEWPKPSIALKNVSSAPRVKRASPTTKFAMGKAGTIIQRFRSSPRGSS